MLMDVQPDKSVILNLNEEDKLLVEAFAFLLKNNKTTSYATNVVTLDFYNWGVEGCFNQEYQCMLFLNLRYNGRMMQYNPQLECTPDFSKIINLLILNPHQKYTINLNRDSFMKDNKRDFLQKFMKPFMLRMLL